MEEHSVIGCLGSAVAEVLAELGTPGLRFRRFGVPEGYGHVVGSQEHLSRQLGGLPELVRSLLRSTDTALR